MAAPQSEPQRTGAFDALAGLAVIGLVIASGAALAMPQQAFFNPIVAEPGAAADRAAWLTGFVFLSDVFRLLVAMLFGGACLLAFGTPGNRRRRHVAAMMVFFAFGIVHAVLISDHDILRALAIAGLAMPVLAALSTRALYAVAIGFVAVHVGAGLVVFGASVIDHYAGRVGTDAALFVERSFGRDRPALEHALELGRREFGLRLWEEASLSPRRLWLALADVPSNLAAMTLGMALWKDRMLTRDWRIFRMQRLAAIAALIALPALFAFAFWLSYERFPAALVGAVAMVLTMPFHLLLALSYASLGMAFFGGRGWTVRALGSVGRLALTNYLIATVFLTAIYSGWGLGLFGLLSRAETLAVAALPVMVMLAWSPVWERILGTGPAEWLWRRAVQLVA